MSVISHSSHLEQAESRRLRNPSAKTSRDTYRSNHSDQLILITTCLLFIANMLQFATARYSIVGDISLLACSQLMILLVWIDRRYVKFPRMICYSFAFYMLVYVLSTLTYPDLDSAKNTAGIYTAFSVFLFFYRYSPVILRAKAIGQITFLLGLSACILGAYFELVAKNTISGVFTYYCLISVFIFLLGLNKLAYQKLVVCGALLVIAIQAVLLDHRSMAGITLISVFLFLSLNHLPQKAIRVLASVGGIVAGIYFFQVMTGGQIELMDELESFFLDSSGRTIQSGRQILWPLVVDYSLERPLFGWGAGVTISQLINTELSAHNDYLQVLLQTGFVGLVALTSVLWSVYRTIRNSGVARLRIVETYGVTVFFIVTMHLMLEVFLTQNNLVIGTLVWCLFGLILGFLDFRYRARGAE